MLRAPFVLISLLALGGVSLGCAGETNLVRVRYLSTHAGCTKEVTVLHREDATPIAEDAPDRDKLRNLLATAKPGHDFYDVHGCDGGAVFECFDEIGYSESGASKQGRHCGSIASWGSTSKAEAAVATSVVFEATDGSKRIAPDDDTTTVSNKTVIASAAHDMPCDAPSIQVAGSDVTGRANAAEGCGLRTTYEIVRFTPDDPAHTGAASGVRYKMTARASTASGPAAPDKSKP